MYIFVNLRHPTRASSSLPGKIGETIRVYQRHRPKFSKTTVAAVVISTVVGGIAVIYNEVKRFQDNLQVVTDVFETEKGIHTYIYVKTEPEEVTRSRNLRKLKLPWKIRKPWFPYMQSSSHDPWTLLKLCQSEKRSVRLLGVQSLAKDHHWSDADYQMISQVLDYRTLVGLARTKDANLKLFLPPPRVAPSELSLEEELRRLLTSLPTDSVDQCTKYFTSSALQQDSKTLAEERGGLWCFGGNGLAFASSLSPVPEELVITFCLQALIMHTRGEFWEIVQSGEFYKLRIEQSETQKDMLSLQAILGHSQVASHCPEIVKNDGLKILRRIQEARSSSIKILRSIARILGNLALHAELHDEIIRGGWVTFLLRWMRSPDLALSLHATKALANLDRDFGGSHLYPDGVYLYYPQYRYSEPVYADIVFIHGLLGGPFRTWRQKDPGRPVPKSAIHPQKPKNTQPISNSDTRNKPVSSIQNSDDTNSGTTQNSKARNTRNSKDIRTQDGESQKGVSESRGSSMGVPQRPEDQEWDPRTSKEPYTFCWPKDWLAADCPHVRIMTVEYETHLSDWAPKCPHESEKRTLAVRSQELLDKLCQSGVGNRPIIWVAHSMGGLLLKEMLVSAKNHPTLGKFVDQTKGVIFYSVPHRGSPLAGYSHHTKYLLYPSVEVKELKQGSEHLLALQDSFRDLMFDTGIPLLSFAEGAKTELPLNLRMQIVPAESTDPGFGEFHYMENLNHLNICKPSHKGAALYQLTLDFIKDCLPHHLVEKILKSNLGDEYILPEEIPVK